MFVLLMAAIMLSGCSLFTVQQDDDPKKIQQTVTQIRVITKTAMGKYLDKVAKKNPEKALKLSTDAIEKFDKFIEPVLNKDKVSMTAVAIDTILSKIQSLDEKWKDYLKDGWDIFESVATLPSGDEVMNSKGVQYFRAFLQGVKEACVRFKEEQEDNG